MAAFFFGFGPTAPAHVAEPHLMLKKFSLFALPLVVLACSDSANTTDDPQSMLPRVQSFESARAGLDLESTTHVSEVMKGADVGHVAVEELHWASSSEQFTSEMSARLQELKSCSNSAGVFVDISYASAALADLGHELRGHQVGMVTTVDLETAQAVEMAFQARQGMLLVELRSYFEAFEAMAGDYDCAF